jgi:hypothetical protein
LQKVGQGAVADMFRLKIANYTTHKTFKFQCVASGGFGTDFTNKKKVGSITPLFSFHLLLCWCSAVHLWPPLLFLNENEDTF